MIIKSNKSKPLQGEISPPADKSISHRAVILSSLSNGISYIENLLLSEDIETTISWAKQLGVTFAKHNNKLEVCSNIINNNKLIVNKTFKFYMGNSGTSSRLLMGVMAGLGYKSLFYGDASLQKRPMLRVIAPLMQMGAKIFARDTLDTNCSLELINKSFVDNDTSANQDDVCNNLSLISKDTTKAYLPVVLQKGNLRGINYNMNVDSAQVKSAILLAGLFTKDEVVVKENVATRDHTENMLLAAGVNLNIKASAYNGAKVITLHKGSKTLKPCNWQVPGDFSSAAFIIVAGLLVPESKLLIKGVNLNPLRTGLLHVLQQMGANLKISYKNKVCGELFGDIEVNYTKDLRPASVNKELVPLMIDEFPILFCLSSLIKGESKFLGIRELRHKESDRILAVESNLNKLGVITKSTEDSLIVQGNPNFVNKEVVSINSNLDHRIAMSFLVLGLVVNSGIIVKDANTINTSFPTFVSTMKQLGANINIINSQ